MRIGCAGRLSLTPMTSLWTGTDAPSGDLDAARMKYEAALRRAHTADAHVGTALGLDALATVALDRGDVPRAIRLAAAADRLRSEIGGKVTLSQVGIAEPLVRAARPSTSGRSRRVAL